MRLRYTLAALAHLEAIHNFLSERNPAVARRIASDIRAAARRLSDFPHMGRNGEAFGTREWAVRRSPYVIVYEVDFQHAEIRVLGVFHGARDRDGRTDQ
jgi:plasmid stabilization system protein ParE